MGAIQSSDLSTNEYDKLRSHVTLKGENLVEMIEIGEITIETVQIKFARLRELATEDKTYCLLVDATQSNVPSGRVRFELQNQFAPLKNVKHVALYNGQNFIMNMVAQFVLGKLAMTSTSVHKTEEQALESLKPYLV